MAPEDIQKSDVRFNRKVAFWLCAVPILFSVQCAFVAFLTPLFVEIFADMGAQLPLLTRIVVNTWGIFAGFSFLAPIAAIVLVRSRKSDLSMIVSISIGIAMFIIAQVITVALFLPFFELGSALDPQ